MDFTGIEPEFLLQLYQRLVLRLLWVFAGSACLLTIVFLLLCSLEYFSSPRSDGGTVSVAFRSKC